MIYLKTHEEIYNKPQVGDYIVSNFPENEGNRLIRQFSNNNIGIVIDINNNYITIKYENIPDELKHDNIFKFTAPESYFKWSKSKEEIEIYINTKKYNL